MACMLLSLGSVSADSVSISQVIHLTGIMPPMRNIVVDEQKNIIEITSNTPEDVTPVVYQGKLAAGNEIPFDAGLQKAYADKIRGKDLHSIDLHFAAPRSETARSRALDVLGDLSRLPLLPFSHLF